jgi:phosphoribosyl 1,2-cyclic phosphate phosphodiesterase
VLITHAHADHAHGLDDVRPLTRGKPLPILASRDDVAELRRRFSYAFGDGQEGGGKPRLELAEMESVAVAGGMVVTAIPLMHGERRIQGYRIGDFAYLTDCSSVPEPSMRLLTGLRLLVVDALRLRPHPTHFSLGEALGLARILEPERLLLTHMCHDLSHEEFEAACAEAGLPFPAGPAWDGLEVDL